MNSIEDLINSMTPDIYQSLKRAIELGKWPNGERLSKEQRDLCMQGVIAYEQKYIPETERTGYIETKKHTHCGSEKGEVILGEGLDDVQPLNFKD